MIVETEFLMGIAYLFGLGTDQDIKRGEELLASVVYKAGPEHLDYIRMCGNSFMLGEIQCEGEEQLVKIKRRPELAMYCMKRLEEWE